MTNDLTASLERIEAEPDLRVLKRVPEQLDTTSVGNDNVFQAAIIDLETTGLDSEQNEIIEIGTLIADFHSEQGFVSIRFTDNQLQQPNEPIPTEITAITGITNEDVEGQSIDWQRLIEALEPVDLIICHNARFDRGFLERQTPEAVSKLIQRKAFGCSSADINWRELGYESAKLEYLNFKMGFFYDGHRALVDCWATLNILHQSPRAFDELKASVRNRQRLICAVNAPFEQKDILKARGYRWSDGSRDLPKCWYGVVAETDYDDELAWLQEQVYGGRPVNLPTGTINAFNRYSGREYRLSDSD